jgi:hypothetical protein
VELVNAYCTEDDLRENLGDDDARLPSNLLIRALNASSRAVDNYCFGETGVGFYLADTATPKLFETTNPDELIVYPFGTLTGLAIASDDAGSRTWTGAWAATDYWPGPLNGPTYTRLMRAINSGRYFSGIRWPSVGANLTQVTARWGYATKPVEVEAATLLKSASLFSRKDSPMGVATFGDFAALRVTRRDPDVMELLSTYVLDVAMVG